MVRDTKSVISINDAMKTDGRAGSIAPYIVRLDTRRGYGQLRVTLPLEPRLLGLSVRNLVSIADHCGRAG
jgi:hypothetical protein